MHDASKFLFCILSESIQHLFVMPLISVPVHAVQSMVFAINTYPVHYPKRMKHINEFVHTRAESLPTDAPHIIIGSGKKDASPVPFDYTLKQCRELFTFVMKHPVLLEDVSKFAEKFYLSSLGTETGHSEVMLLPSSKQCVQCGMDWEVDARPSYPLVFTRDGVKVAACFTGRCKNCHIAYHHSYFTLGRDCDTQLEGGNGNRIFNKDISTSKFLQISSATVFELSYLCDVHYNIVYGGMTFEAAARAYNAVHGAQDAQRLQGLKSQGRTVSARTGSSVWMLSAQRLEEGWFMWRILEKVKNRSSGRDCMLKLEM